MNSHDSKPQTPVDSFDDSDLDDIAQLFDSFEQESQSIDPHLEQWVKETEPEDDLLNLSDDEDADDFSLDLLNLFDDNPPKSPPSPIDDSQPLPGQRNPLSSLPSDKEIIDLFGEIDWDLQPKPPQAPQVSPSSVEPVEDEDSDDELLALFNDSNDHVGANLETSETYPEDLETYEVIEELADFLESSATPEPIPDFAALEALIDAPAFLSEAETGLEARGYTEAKNISKTATTPHKDGLWAEMEEIAKKVGHKIAVSASPSAMVASQNNASRPTKKGFEETVRVSVKQLDNLSNLIGELVVKRNRLGDDQNRLRQFLDNLLNHVQSLSDVGGRMQDLYERTLLEGALLASRATRSSYTDTSSTHPTPSPEGGENLETRHENLSYKDNQDLDALEMDRFTGFHLLSQEMIELIVRVREATSDIQFLVDETDQVGRSLRQTTDQLQEGMTKTRMVPFGPSADRLVRPVRDISRQLNKQARLNVEGKDVLIDKMILEHLSSPLTHLVNNAVTHGIETVEERRKKGKSAEGHINVRAFLQGNQTVITFTDDGGGIDPEKIKKKAIEKNLVSKKEASDLSDSELYDFLFNPGFSTKEQADEYSGRGVGLDVVRTSLIDIRGSVTINSEIDKGTTFTIRLPLTLSICKALPCLSNHARIAFPMDGVEDIKDYCLDDLPTNDQGKRCIRWGKTLLPIYGLNELLVYNHQLSRGNVYGGKPLDDTISIVILRGAGSYLAIQVDQVDSEKEIVIKQIEGPAPKPPGIAGATVLGDGTIMPIGDVLELIEIAQGRIRTDGGGSLWRATQSFTSTLAGQTKPSSEPIVLIIDDSLTVRQYLSHSFSKAGYRVEQARDGQEAWEKLRSGLPCDLIFCDIEMPRMNGLELLSSLQKDERLSEIPVALLTSRGADRHRKVAAKLGASGYYIKPAPDAELLEAAQRMIEGEVLLPGSVRKPTFKPVEATTPDTPPEDPSANETSKAQPLVLIIDDSVMVREMLSQTFSGAGYRYEQARDGQDALEKLRSGLQCDLILCDIEMPKMNGLELLSRLQSDDVLSQIPVAMITSRGAQKMQQIAAERGAKGYLVKPYIEEVLLDYAKRLIAGEVLLDVDSLSEV